MFCGLVSNCKNSYVCNLEGANQCTRLKPSYEFHFWRALKISTLQLKGWFKSRLQSKNIKMKYKIHIKVVHELCGTCFRYNVEKFRINHLTPLLVVTMPYACWFLWWANYIEDFKWRLHFQLGVAFWRIAWREVYFEGPNRVWRALKTSILNSGGNNAEESIGDSNTTSLGKCHDKP